MAHLWFAQIRSSDLRVGSDVIGWSRCDDLPIHKHSDAVCELKYRIHVVLNQ